RDIEGPGSAFDPAQMLTLYSNFMQNLPLPSMEAQTRLTQDTFDLWQSAFAGFGPAIGASTGAGDAALGESGEVVAADRLPRKDRRFADNAWRQNPAAILLHQSYLLLSEYLAKAARSVEGLDAEKKDQLRFATEALAEAMSPSNFLLTNPQVLQRTMDTKGQSLVAGMRNLIADLERGQLTHTDPDAFKLGENLAATPGKVVHETPLYQLVQYSPTTKEVFEVPLVIFPPWINRFYILDLTAKKSFIKWAVDQGLTVFVVSWKSADGTMSDIVWDDYIRAQIEAIDHVRERLDVPAVHTIGYCVAGTTLAATLAILARREEADRVKSATFFTAQVDFEHGGDLKHFIEDSQLDLIGQLAPEGYLDGRYLAATFNALRGKDLIWNYVVNNYLLGEDYPAFDLLHWNGDVTNLPAKWHSAYLKDLYRDNKLVQPDALEADGTPIDLTRVETPTFIQAGRDDHIAPAKSVWRMTDHFAGPTEFVLAGSGHIAGVVNPPEAKKYQYWTGDAKAGSLDTFVEKATEHPGSWWPHWLDWVEKQAPDKVAATGKRKPGGRGDKTIEDAPGRYVKTR
ncbi:MAG: class I poly(R)-hydroxyalkanoic acid synthase, partial [Erythrobacter sp.]